MFELFLSDITVMGKGYCVIGLEPTSSDSFRSVRPFPPGIYAWREPFRYKRGDGVRFHEVPTIAKRPHVEDQQSRGLVFTGKFLSEEELIDCLRKAEVSSDLAGLFESPVQTSTQGGRALWVNPQDARRSICGCEYVQVRFRVYPEPGGWTLRAEIVLSSNERVPSIPVVDREWRRFVQDLMERIHRSAPAALAERFLNRTVGTKFFLPGRQFARIGLPRPREDRHCWLMLDSLFPQPKEAWLDEL